MSLIDWSDPDEMLGLLVEFVAGEALTENDDAERADFLRDLSVELEELSHKHFVAVSQISDALGEIRAAQPTEFLNDAVISHVDACIEELNRIGSHATRARAV